MINNNSGPNINKDFYEKKGPDNIQKLSSPILRPMSGMDLIQFSQSSGVTSKSNNASNQTHMSTNESGLLPVSEQISTSVNDAILQVIPQNVDITTDDSVMSYGDSSQYINIPNISALNINSTDNMPQISALISSVSSSSSELTETNSSNIEQTNNLAIVSATNLHVNSTSVYNIPNISRLQSPPQSSYVSNFNLPNISGLINNTHDDSLHNIPQISMLNSSFSSVQSSLNVPNLSAFLLPSEDGKSSKSFDGANIPTFLMSSNIDMSEECKK